MADDAIGRIIKGVAAVEAHTCIPCLGLRTFATWIFEYGHWGSPLSLHECCHGGGPKALGRLRMCVVCIAERRFETGQQIASDATCGRTRNLVCGSSWGRAETAGSAHERSIQVRVSFAHD